MHYVTTFFLCGVMTFSHYMMFNDSQHVYLQEESLLCQMHLENNLSQSTGKSNIVALPYKVSVLSLTTPTGRSFRN